MFIVEIRKSGEVIDRRPLDDRVDGDGDGWRILIDDGREIEVFADRIVHAGDLEARVLRVPPPAASRDPQIVENPPLSGDTPTCADVPAPGLPPASVTDDGASHPAMELPGAEALRVDGYQVLSLLGTGGMGTVWRATQLSTQRTVALKLMHSARIAAPRARARFEREVELAARLEHPNIARIYDSGIRNGTYFYAMELIEGVGLDHHVKDQKLDRGQILGLMQTVCLAVDYAHRHRIIHRDLKPSNIFVDAGGEPRILDFGLAASIDARDSKSAVTVDGDIAGTIIYMSPEQAAGHLGDLDVRSDVYTLGVILYQLLLGSLPHSPEGAEFEIRKRIIEQEPRRPRGVDPTFDRELEAILLKTLAKEPDARYRSAADLADDIDAFLRGDPISARPLTIGYLIRKRLWKRRVPIAIAAAVLLAGTALSSFAYVRIGDERARADREAAAELRSRYFGEINLVQRAIDRGDTDSAHQHLAACPKELRRWEWHRLNYLADSSVFTIEDPDDVAVLAMTHLADPPRIVTVNAKRRCRISDGETGALLQQASFGDAPAKHAQITDDGATLAFIGDDGVIEVWLRDPRELIARIEDPDGQPRRVELGPAGDRIAYRLGTDRVRVWDVKAKSMLVDATAPRGPSMLRFASDGDSIYCTGRSVAAWRLPDGEPIDAGFLPLSDPRDFEFSKDGQRILQRNGRVCHILAKEKDQWRSRQIELPVTPLGVRFAADSERLILTDANSVLLEVDIATGIVRSRLLGHRGLPNNVVPIQNTRRLMTATRRGVVVWDLDRADGHVQIDLFDEIDVAWTMVLERPVGDDLLMIAGSIGRLARFPRESERAMDERAIVFPEEQIAAAWHPSGDYALSIGVSGIVFRILPNGEVLPTDVLLDPAPPHIAFSPDGRVLTTISDGVRVWSEDLTQLVGHVPDASAFDWNTRAELLVAVPDGDNPRLQNLAVVDLTKRSLRIIAAAVGPHIYQLKADPTGRRVAIVDTDQGVTMLDLVTMQTSDTLTPYPGKLVQAITFDPSGDRLITAGASVRVWDTNTLNRLCDLAVGDGASATQIQFLRHRNRIAAGSTRGSVHLYSAIQP